MRALVTQLCPVLCNPMDGSLPSSLSMEFFQASVFGWVAIPFCRASSHPTSPELQADCLLSWATRKTCVSILKQVLMIFKLHPFLSLDYLPAFSCWSGFTDLSPVDRWGWIILWWGCPGHCRVFSSVHGFNVPHASSNPTDINHDLAEISLQALTTAPAGQNLPRVEIIAVKLCYILMLHASY